MKPIKLVLSAYGPFPDKTVIDFDKLGSDGVFLISGPTGSGKTTIFDGICYALYGTASGNLRTPKMMRSTYAEPDIKTFVELTFSSHDKEYRIKRRPEQEIKKIKGNGTTVRPSDVSLEILDGGSTVLTGKREVEEKIKEIIGLDANQFRQVTMIAQGEFLKVLNSSTEERMEIFSKIFKTGRYTWLQEELKLAVKDMSTCVSEIEKELNQEFNSIFTPEFLENEDASIDLSGLLYTQKKDMLEKAYHNIKEKGKENIVLKDELMKEKEQLIKESANLESIINHFSKLNEISDKLENLDSEKDSIVKNQNSIPKMKKDIEDMISTISKLEALIPRYQKLEAHRDKISKQSEELNSRKENIRQLNNKCDQIKKSLDSNKTNLEKIEKELNTSEDVNIQLNLRLNFQSSLEKVLNIIERIETLNKKFNEVSEKAREHQIAYISLKEEYNNMEVFYLKQQAGILARDLEDDKPCPVCGSTSHPNPAKSADVLFEKADLESKKSELEKAEDIFNKSSQEASLIKGNRDVTEEEFKSSIATLKNSFDEQKNSFKKIIAEYVNDSFDLTKENYLNINAILREEINNLKEIQSTLVEYKKKHTLLKASINEYEKDLNTLIEDNNNQKEDYNRLAGEYKASKELYENELTQLEYKNLESLNAIISNRRSDLDKGKKEITDLETKIENYYTQYNNLISGRQTLLSLIEGKNETVVRNDYESFNLKVDNLKTQIVSVEYEITENLSISKNISRALDIYEKSLPILDDKKNLLDQYSNLSATCSGELPGKAKIKLETFVQMAFLDRILARANIRLLKMSEGRYMLNRDDKGDNKRSQTGLDLSVHDLSNNTFRSTKSLSGGESFQASLCLALGFADEIQNSSGGIQIETMFIDEGFGTLDNVALKNAVDSLVDLSKGNKLVGIISHVDELRERIDKGINIEKSSFKGSKLTIQS